ncbi:MAG: hypothetical protein F6K41_37650 [Symploca sp. SIO3E6]|nr:hypothetical protein [Caldora sp. SIO3E6]
MPTALDTRQTHPYRYTNFIPISNFQFPIPNSQFPIPNSQFPIPNSQFPILNSHFLFPAKSLIQNDIANLILD